MFTSFLAFHSRCAANIPKKRVKKDTNKYQKEKAKKKQKISSKPQLSVATTGINPPAQLPRVSLSPTFTYKNPANASLLRPVHLLSTYASTTVDSSSSAAPRAGINTAASFEAKKAMSKHSPKEHSVAVSNTGYQQNKENGQQLDPDTESGYRALILTVLRNRSGMASAPTICKDCGDNISTSIINAMLRKMVDDGELELETTVYKMRPQQVNRFGEEGTLALTPMQQARKISSMLLPDNSTYGTNQIGSANISADLAAVRHQNSDDSTNVYRTRIINALNNRTGTFTGKGSLPTIKKEMQLVNSTEQIDNNAFNAALRKMIDAGELTQGKSTYTLSSKLVAKEQYKQRKKPQATRHTSNTPPPVRLTQTSNITFVNYQSMTQQIPPIFVNTHLGYQPPMLMHMPPIPPILVQTQQSADTRHSAASDTNSFANADTIQDEMGMMLSQEYASAAANDAVVEDQHSFFNSLMNQELESTPILGQADVEVEDNALAELLTALNPGDPGPTESRTSFIGEETENHAKKVTVVVDKPSKESKVGLSIQQGDGFIKVSRIEKDGLFAGTELTEGMVLDSINGMECTLTREALPLFQGVEGSLTLVAHMQEDVHIAS